MALTVGEFVHLGSKALRNLTEGVWEARKFIVFCNGVPVADCSVTAPNDTRPNSQKEYEAEHNAAFVAHAKNHYAEALKVIVWQSKTIEDKDKELKRLKDKADELWQRNEAMYRELIELRKGPPPVGRVFNDNTPVPN